MKELTLAKMQQLGLHKWMSSVKIEKAIFKALQNQKESLCNIEEDVVKNLDDLLVAGGEFSYKVGKKSYKLSVLTPTELISIENIDNLNEQGVEYDLPTKYKFHCMLANGNRLFVKAKDYIEAQAIVDELLGSKLYKVSCSKI